jgi:DNA-binding NtrC family response regulator
VFRLVKLQPTFCSAMKPKVLLVDDELSIRESLARALQSEGYDVVAVSTGQEALSYLCETDVSLVLLDISLPGINGWDTFEQMMALSPFLPVIIITARPNQQPVAARAGAAAILEKPLALPSLLELMRQAVSETLEARRRRLARHETLLLPSLWCGRERP